MNGLGRRLRLGCLSDIPACAARSGVELEPGRRLTDSTASSESDNVKSTTVDFLMDVNDFFLYDRSLPSIRLTLPFSGNPERLSSESELSSTNGLSTPPATRSLTKCDDS